MTNTIIQTKEVTFQNAILLAVQDNSNQIWVGVSHVCNGIGFNKSQKDTQIQNVQTDIVLNRGCLKFQAGVFDPNNATIAILIDFLPLWLAKISITPTMKKNNPKIVEKLIAYQLKAKDVLSSAFLPQAQSAPTNTSTLDRTMQALQQTQKTLTDCAIEHTSVLKDHETRITQHEENTSTLTQEIKELKETSRIIVPDVADRRFHGDEDTLSTNEYEAQCASDLPTKEFAEWIHNMIHKIASKEKLGLGCGNIWRMSYKGLQMSNGKQVSCLSDLLDECYISYRYIYALRLTTMLYKT